MSEILDKIFCFLVTIYRKILKSTIQNGSFKNILFCKNSMFFSWESFFKFVIFPYYTGYCGRKTTFAGHNILL